MFWWEVLESSIGSDATSVVVVAQGKHDLGGSEGSDAAVYFVVAAAARITGTGPIIVRCRFIGHHQGW